MNKKILKNALPGLMPNGNIVRYDTTETPGLPGKPKRGKMIYEEAGDIPENAIAEIKKATRKPRKKPAPKATQPAEPLTDPLEEAIKQLTPKQLEIGNRQAEAGELFEKLLKSGIRPRVARRMVLKQLNVRIAPDNSQPYVKPKPENCGMDPKQPLPKTDC